MTVRIFNNDGVITASELILNYKVVATDNSRMLSEDTMREALIRLKEEVNTFYFKYFKFDKTLTLRVRSNRIEQLYDDGNGTSRIGTVCRERLDSSLVNMVMIKNNLMLTSTARHIINRKLKSLTFDAASPEIRKALSVDEFHVNKPVHIFDETLDILLKDQGLI